jgi:hypothetical protein
MTTELTVMLPDGPGVLARVGTILGDARVNIEAIHGSTLGPHAVMQLVAADPDQAEFALAAAGITCTRREVLVVRVLDQPGMLGEVALVMAKAGIEIDSVYVTTRGHIVLGVDDVDGAIQVAGGLAVMAWE